MLKKFAVALIAAGLIASPALAQGNGTAATAPVHHVSKSVHKTFHKSTLNTHAAKRHVAHKHAATKHFVKHHAKKHVHVSKVKHGKAVKRIVKPVHKTIG